MSIFVIALNQNLFEEGDNKLNPRIQTSVSKIVSYINIDDHVILTLPPTIQSTQNQQAISIDKKGLNLKKAFQEAFNKKQCDCTVIYEPNSLVINKTETIYRDFDSVHRIKFNQEQTHESVKQHQFLSRVYDACCMLTYEQHHYLHNGLSTQEMFPSLLAQVLQADVLLMLTQVDALLLSDPKGNSYHVKHMRSNKVRTLLANHDIESHEIRIYLKQALSFVETCRQSSAILTSLDGLHKLHEGAGTLITFG